MAYWIHESGNRNNSAWKFFICDFISDLTKLPTAFNEGAPQPNDTVCKNKCSPGSKCFCIEDGSTWILGKDTNKWIKTNISYNSSDETTDVKSISSSSIESLFL